MDCIKWVDLIKEACSWGSMNISCNYSINPCHQMVQPKEVKILQILCKGRTLYRWDLGWGWMSRLSGACSCPCVSAHTHSPALWSLVSPSSYFKTYLAPRAQLKSHLLHEFFPDDLLCQDFFAWLIWQFITCCLGTSTRVLGASLCYWSDDSCTVSICAKMFTSTISCSSLWLVWAEITLMLSVESQVSCPKTQWKRPDKHPSRRPVCSAEAGHQRSSLLSSSLCLSLSQSPSSPLLVFPSLYQNPLGFTCSHKGTKEDKGLWTPLLGEKLPLHLVREKEVRLLSP